MIFLFVGIGTKTYVSFTLKHKFQFRGFFPKRIKKGLFDSCRFNKGMINIGKKGRLLAYVFHIWNVLS